MISFRKVFLLSVLLGLISAYARTAGAQQPAHYYEQGKQDVSQGNTEKALNTWLQAKGVLEVPDTRIGIAFIELVAAEEMDGYYEFATLMYQWGLSAKEVAPNSDALKTEIERLRILTGHKLYKRWWDLWKSNDPQIYNELSAFWKQLDPTPTTAYNERLIEHWQRIAYSREHFTRNKSGVFNADDRAEAYIRYGKPTLTRNGLLSFNTGTAFNYISDIAAAPYFASVPSSREVEIYVRNAQNYHRNPEYEIWVYKKGQTSITQNIFIFGTVAETGKFELVESVEDFIPNKAFSVGQGGVPPSSIFSSVSGNLSNIRSGLILQIMYYEQLSSTDIFFGKMFNRITSRAIDSGGEVSTSLGQEMLTHAKFDLKRQKLNAPREESTYNNLMVDIPLSVYQYKLLDENNRPYYATFVESKPQRSFLLDYLSNYSQEGDKQSVNGLNSSGEFSNYQFTHTMQLYDINNELKSQATASPVITTKKGSYSSSLFFVPAVEKGVQQIFSAKLENKDVNSEFAVKKHTPFPQNLRGLGKVIVTQQAPLASDESGLQIGDLILGYGYDSSASIDNSFPFIIAHKRKIPQNKELVLHFEIYNFKKNSEGIYDVKLSYQIKPKEGILGWFKKEEENLKLALNLESKQSRYVENLQIKTRALKPGSYVLEVMVEDIESQQKVERNFEFEVVDSR